MRDSGLQILDIRDPRWSEFAQRHADATLFHHPAWAGLLAESYRYRPLALATADAAGQITAGLPAMDVSGPLTGRRWVALPFTDYCPALGAERPVRDLVDGLVAEARARHLDALELRGPLPADLRLYGIDRDGERQASCSPLPADAVSSARFGSGGYGARLHAQADAVRHTSALGDDPDAVYRRFSKMHQRNIRKAEKAGLRIERGHSARDVRAFYRLHLLTRRRLGVPIQPRRFFRLLAGRLLERGLGFVLTAYAGDAPAAAAVFLAWNGTLIYKYGASDPRYRDSRPNNLLFWTAIRWACEHGYHTLDWGRTDLEDEGLRQFKSGWGAREEPLIYTVVADAPPGRSSGRLRRAMGTVIRRSPPVVCQVLGEYLYRYAA